MNLKYFVGSVFFGIIASVFLGTLAAEEICPDLIARIHMSEKSDWDFHHGSTKGIILGSAAILTATEAGRAINGFESFNLAFLTNSGIDLLMTFIAHQVALIKLPEKVQRLLNEKTEFLLRSGSNTILDSAIMISIWQAVAASKGVHIDNVEKLSAVIFCAITYGVLQLWRSAAFIKMPKKLDLKYIAKLRKANLVFNSLAFQAHQKANEHQISPEQEELLLLTFLENLINTMPFEKRIITDTPLFKYGKNVESAKSRKKMIQKLLALYKKTQDQVVKDEVERVLYLGLPFTMEESMEFHFIFAERQKKKDRLKLGSTIVDRILGSVIAGGLVMRHMTGDVLKD